MESESQYVDPEYECRALYDELGDFLHKDEPAVIIGSEGRTIVAAAGTYQPDDGSNEPWIVRVGDFSGLSITRPGLPEEYRYIIVEAPKRLIRGKIDPNRMPDEVSQKMGQTAADLRDILTCTEFSPQHTQEFEAALRANFGEL